MAISRELIILPEQAVSETGLGGVLGIQIVQVPNEQAPVQSCDCSDGGCIGDGV